MPRRSDDPRPPLVSEPDLPEQLEDAEGVRGKDLLASRLRLGDVTDLAHTLLEQCVIEANGSTLDLSGATLIDVEVRQARLADVRARDAGLRRVRIVGGRIGTLDLSDTRIHELHLQGVRIDYLTLSGTKATDVLVEDCQLGTLDLPGATVSRAAFPGSRADEVDTRGLRAEHVDLRGLDALSFLDVGSLRGTTMSIRQVELLAAAFATATGISVRD